MSNICGNLIHPSRTTKGSPTENKLAKARKTRNSPSTLGLKKFGLGKLGVKKVWAKSIFIGFLDEWDNFKILF